MTSYDITQWCDFARGVDPDAAPAMRAHLAQAGRRERRMVRRFERVTTVAHKDHSLEVPHYAVRIAKAAASLRRPAGRLARRPFTMVFDSLLQAATATGTRNAQPSHRQIVYRADEYTVEIRLEQETNPHGQVMVGQVLHHLDESRPVPRVPVLVLSDGRVVGSDLTSRFGEFQAAGLPNESLQLCLMVDQEACIDVPLRRAVPMG